MTGNDVLIVSPTNVKFQAPFPHMQKRQLSLLNLGAQPIVYSIDIRTDRPTETVFQVLPSSGKVAAFDTIELSVLMQPTLADQPGCSLTVKHRIKSSIADLSESEAAEDWTQAQTTRVNITMENCMGSEKELLGVFGLDGNGKSLMKLMEQQYQPLCNQCSLKRIPQSPKKRTWVRRSLWPMLVVLLSIVAVYFVWIWPGLGNNLLNSDMVY